MSRWTKGPDVLGLTPADFTFLAAAVFIAGVVRGFAGFAFSALVMASCITILPPVELIPICTMLEMVASSVLLNGNVAGADRGMVIALQSGAVVGTPIGLALTTRIDPQLSGLVALAVITTLALLQLARLRLPVGSGPVPAVATGLVAGTVTGLASVGGMVTALYLLARQLPARVTRSSMILLVFFGGTLAVLWQLVFGMVTLTAVARMAAFALPCLAGVLLGRRLFLPQYERYYRPFCLVLLVGLAGFGLIRRIAA